MRYTPPVQKETEAFERGQRSMTFYIVLCAIIGLVTGFFVGKAL